MKKNDDFIRLLVAVAVLSCAGVGAEEIGDEGTDSSADLAQDLTNPLADLITVPVQMTTDWNLGPNDKGRKIQTNIQPVIPFDLAEEWTLITRTILPIIDQKDIFPGAGSQFGLGDATVSLFASPKAPAGGKLIWGAGPVLLMPTATDDLLGAEKWGAGPTAVLLTMQGPWTFGGLGNHIWSFAGDSGRPSVNNTFLQPFVAYTTPDAWTFSLQSESTYNWKSEKWSIPVNAAISRLVFIGKLPVSLQAGAGYWMTSPDAAAEGWRFRLQANFVLPKP